MLKTYSFKLYNSKRNKPLIKLIEFSAEIYNHCIALHKRYYKLYHVYLDKYKLQSHITKLKKLKRYSHWSELNSQAIQDITDRIDRAYQLFFSNLKRKVRCAPPSFKKRRKYKSFTLKQTGYKLLDGNKIKIGKKECKFFKSRDITGKVKAVTVKRNILGDIYICIVCEQESTLAYSKLRTGKSVGFDFGLKKFLTASDGNDVESPLFFKQHQNSIKKLNRSLSRKKPGSKKRQKAKHKLAKEHIKITNQRKDYHFKLAIMLCVAYDIICLEDLNIKGMQRMWGKKVSDLSHSKFVDILNQQAVKYGTKIIEIPRFYPSSKTCHICGHVLNELALKVRSWVCPSCNVLHDRDYNAAVNILRVGTSTLVGDTVSPSSLG